MTPWTPLGCLALAFMWLWQSHRAESAREAACLVLSGVWASAAVIIWSLS